MAAAVDPVEADKVLAKAEELEVQITTVLTTHSHWDHAGGNKALRDLVLSHTGKALEAVVGGEGDGVEAVTREVAHGDVVRIGDLSVDVLFTPCHTRGHVLYHCQDALFTGDTLFIAGCGRFFAGTPAEMNYALNELVAKLPVETKIYCGHEYTTSNLRFASHVEPQNEAVQAKLYWAIEQQRAEKPTIPSTIADELATNPFMRVHEASVQRFVGGATDPVAVMGLLRSAKDKFGVGKGKI